jgi:hypothetical protein
MTLARDTEEVPKKRAEASFRKEERAALKAGAAPVHLHVSTYCCAAIALPQIRNLRTDCPVTGSKWDNSYHFPSHGGCKPCRNCSWAASTSNAYRRSASSSASSFSGPMRRSLVSISFLFWCVAIFFKLLSLALAGSPPRLSFVGPTQLGPRESAYQVDQCFSRLAHYALVCVPMIGDLPKQIAQLLCRDFLGAMSIAWQLTAIIRRGCHSNILSCPTNIGATGTGESALNRASRKFKPSAMCDVRR